MPERITDMFDPLINLTLLAAVLLLLIAMALWRYIRAADRLGPAGRIGLLTARLVAVAALAWAMLGPTVLEHDQPGTQRTSLTVLLDTSASMAVRDVYLPGGVEAVSRLEALAGTFLEPSYLEQLRELGRVRLVGFDERVREWSPGDLNFSGEPVGPQTRLYDAVIDTARRTVSGRGVIVLLSDGHDTGSRASADEAKQLLADTHVTLMAVAVGAAAHRPGISLQAWADADFVFEGQSTTIHAAVSQTGYTGRDAIVELLREGSRISTQPLRLEAGAPQRVRFEIQPDTEPGQTLTVRGYQVRVHVEDGATGSTATEADRASRWVFVQVSRERIRVALFEGEPAWDTQFLARTLRSDPQIDLHSFFALHPRRTIHTYTANDDHDAGVARGGPPDLSAFDVVILGRGIEAFFPGEQAQRLVDFVQQHGGAIVLARGRPFDATDHAARLAAERFSAVEPVAWGQRHLRDLRLRLTEAGRTSPLLNERAIESLDALATRLPDMLAATQIEAERAATVVLLQQVAAGSPPMAGLVHQRVGDGRVLAMLSEGMWRWAFLPSSLREYDSVYHVFWSRAIRWLATGGEFLPGQDVSLTLDRLSIEPGESVQAVVTARNIADDGFEPRMRLIAPDGTAEPVALARPQPQTPRYVGTLRPIRSGLYRVEVESDASPTMPAIRRDSRLAVQEQSIEMLDTAARPGLLKELAEATGGICLGLDERDQLTAFLDAWQLATTDETRRRHIFDRPWVFALILGGFGIEWIARRRMGLA